MIGILIVDDHPIQREGLKAVFERQPDFMILGEASDGDEAVKKPCDYILMSSPWMS